MSAKGNEGETRTLFFRPLGSFLVNAFAFIAARRIGPLLDTTRGVSELSSLCVSVSDALASGKLYVYCVYVEYVGVECGASMRNIIIYVYL